MLTPRSDVPPSVVLAGAALPIDRLGSRSLAHSCPSQAEGNFAQMTGFKALQTLLAAGAW